MTEAERFERNVHPEPNSGCWLWAGAHLPTGYGHISWKGKPTGAHRVSYEISCGPIPDGLHVLHNCDNPPCVNPGHLRLGTNLQNAHDRTSRGRNNAPIGERNGNSKLFPSEVRAIRSDSWLQRLIARDYGISDASVRDIKAKRTWTHVDD